MSLFACLLGMGNHSALHCCPIIFEHLHGQAPLQSLMADQYNRFKDCLSVVVVNSSVQQDSLRRVLDGDVQLVYISPEAILTNVKYREMLRTQVYHDRLVAFVVDEEW